MPVSDQRGAKSRNHQWPRGPLLEERNERSCRRGKTGTSDRPPCGRDLLPRLAAYTPQAVGHVHCDMIYGGTLGARVRRRWYVATPRPTSESHPTPIEPETRLVPEARARGRSGEEPLGPARAHHRPTVVHHSRRQHPARTHSYGACAVWLRDKRPSPLRSLVPPLTQSPDNQAPRSLLGARLV